MENNCLVEINLDAIRRNILEIKKLVGNKVSIMAILKADAYGHGLEQVAKTCQKGQIDAYGVANLNEGLRLRKVGVRKPILILYAAQRHELNTMIDNGLSITIYDKKIANEIDKVAKNLNKIAKVHLAIDTGMNWYGVSSNEAINVAKKLKQLTNIRIEGIYSHLSQADMKDKTYAKDQLKYFNKILNELEKKGISPKFKHIANSAGALELPESHLNMVRLGIMVYGVYPIGSKRDALILKPALSFKTRVMQTRTLPKGSQISYAGTYITKITSTIAIIPTGYYDGLSRSLSNNFKVIINGNKYPIVGNICMNVAIVDVTGGEVKVDDEVVILGESGKKVNNVEELAQARSTISYEVLTDIGKNQNKKYLAD